MRRSAEAAVVVLPTPRNYLSKFLDDDWMAHRGFADGAAPPRARYSGRAAVDREAQGRRSHSPAESGRLAHTPIPMDL